MTPPELGETDGADEGSSPGAPGGTGERADERTRAQVGVGARDEFGWRGWTLVAAIVVSFLVIPGFLVLFPHVGPAFGLTFRDAYLVLPLVPSVVLAALAVWAAVRRDQ